MKKILVVRRDNIGDLVCTTPALHALRQQFPDAFIGVLVNSYNAEVVQDNPDINAIYIYRKAKHYPKAQRWGIYWQTLRLMCELHREKFDVAILAKSSFDKHGAAFLRWVKPRRLIGFVSPNQSAPLISDPIDQTGNDRLHEVEAVARLLVPLGITQTAYPLRLTVNHAEARKQSQYLMGAEQGLPNLTALPAHPQKKRCLMHISAREIARKWPAEKFVVLIRALANEHQVIPLLCWSPGAANDPKHPGDDAVAADILAQLVRSQTPVIPLPSATLTELIAILSLADEVICIDGGALHLAAALGKPIVALFENRPEKYQRWYPWHARAELVISPHLAVEAISVEAVLNAYQQLSATPSVRASVR